MLLGAGGHAREVAELARACRRAGSLDADLAGYVVDPQFAAAGTLVDGLPILGDLDWLSSQDREGLLLFCAVGAPSLRWRLVERVRHTGLRFATLLHPTATRCDDLEIGEGTMVAAGATLSVAVRLGEHCVVNSGATVAHDGVLDDFATLSPGAHLGGACRLGSGSFVGLGAAVIHRREIGAWSIVGAGATVIEDVPPDATVVGTPARRVSRRPQGWQHAPGHEPV